MSLLHPVDEEFDIRLTSAEVALLVSALWQGDLLLRDLDERQEFVPDLSAMHRDLAKRLEAVMAGNCQAKTLN